MRVDVVTAFQQAGATTIAADADQLAPTLYHADEQVLVPRVDDPTYIPALAGRLLLPIPGAALAYYYVLITWATVKALTRYLRFGVPAVWEKAEGTR